MSRTLTATLAGILAAGAIGTGVALASGQHQQPGHGMQASSQYVQREFRGTIVSVDRAHRMFRMQTCQGTGMRFRVDSDTRYSGGDWDSMHAGWQADVRARRVGGTWIARSVDQSHHSSSHDDSGDDGWDDCH